MERHQIRQILLFLLFACVSTASTAADFITVRHEWVGPGMRYQKVVEQNIPWSIALLEVDLTNPWLVLESCKGQGVLTRPGERLGSRELTSEMSRRHQREGHRVVAAINADFFNMSAGTGNPINIQVENGQLLSMPNQYSAIAFTPEHRPVIERFTFQGAVLHKKSAVPLHGVNIPRAADHLVLYNRFNGDSTRTNAWGAEALLMPLQRWMINDTIACIVEDVALNKGNRAIPEGKVILSGHDRAIPFLAGLQGGDTVRLALQVKPETRPLKEAVGGFPRILRNGRNTALQEYAAEGGSATFATDRHPRTAVGFNADSTRLFLVVVDGRQPDLSVGMNLIELADYMLTLGCTDALNLDGGGSSTLVVADEVVNSPSDGWERAVANALLVISTAAASSDTVTVKTTLSP